MSAPDHIVVIDIGKTNAKLVLVDALSNRAVETMSMPNGVIAGAPYPHYDVDGLWAFTLDGLTDFHRRHGVGGISITTHGATAVFVTGDDLALPVLDYEFDGPDELAVAYDVVRPGFSETLSPRLPAGLNLGAQIYWQAQCFSQEFARMTDILMYPQYWAWRLSGVKASEATSLGCHTDLWAPDASGFSSLVDRQGWRELFPPLRPAVSVLGPIRPELAAATGLSSETPIACGIHDSNASLLPYLQRETPPFSVISTGTWALAMSVGSDTSRLDPARDSLANVDAAGRPVPTARFMAGREFDLLTGGDAPLPSDTELARVVRDKQFILPGFVPGVGPFGDRQGTKPDGWDIATPGERAAMASLYLALVTCVCLDIAGAGDRLFVEGPFATNGVLCGALAALTGKPVFASEDATGTSLGASLLFPRETPRDANGSRSVVPLSVAGLSAYRAAWVAAL
jgi:sugar (pentulose or hexulose) kinase